MPQMPFLVIVVVFSSWDTSSSLLISTQRWTFHGKPVLGAKLLALSQRIESNEMYSLQPETCQNSAHLCLSLDLFNDVQAVISLTLLQLLESNFMCVCSLRPLSEHICSQLHFFHLTMIIADRSLTWMQNRNSLREFADLPNPLLCLNEK